MPITPTYHKREKEALRDGTDRLTNHSTQKADVPILRVGRKFMFFCLENFPNLYYSILSTNHTEMRVKTYYFMKSSWMLAFAMKLTFLLFPSGRRWHPLLSCKCPGVRGAVQGCRGSK